MAKHHANVTDNYEDEEEGDGADHGEEMITAGCWCARDPAPNRPGFETASSQQCRGD